MGERQVMGQTKKWTDGTIRRAVKDVQRQYGIDRLPTPTEIRQSINVNCVSESGIPFNCSGVNLYQAIHVNVGFEELDTLMGGKTMQNNLKLINIYKHFGRDAQIDKLREEVEEFIEALKSGDKAHAAEEAGDVLTVLFGIVLGEEMDPEIAFETVTVKSDRTLERIGTGHYDKGDK